MASPKKDEQKKKEKREKKDAAATKRKVILKNKDIGRSRRVKVSGYQVATHLLLIISAFGAILFGMWIGQPIVWTAGTEGGLSGEEHVKTHEQAQVFAKGAIEEAKSLWAEPASNWRVMYQEAQQKVECRCVTEGPNKSPKNAVARAEGTFRGVTADEVYDFLTSPEGLALLDPAGKNRSDFYQVIEKIPAWNDGEIRAEIAEINIPIPLLSARHFLIQSSMIPNERLFVAKSIVHQSRPGASAYYTADDDVGSLDNTTVRAVATFAIKVDTLPSTNGKEVVVVKMISHVNLFLLEGIMSYISCKWLFPDLFRALHAVFGDENEPLDAAAAEEVEKEEAEEEPEF